MVDEKIPNDIVVPSPATSVPSIEDGDNKYNARLRKRTFRKVDFWLVGFYSLVYIFRVIDSSNYANAAIINLEAGTGIKKQLGFDASKWSWTQSIFSYSYLIFEPTNTILLKKIRPSRWMFVLIFTWGVCACCEGAVKSFQGMMCVRFAIGVAEAGFYPAVLYHMAFWYLPEEMPWRIALFYAVGQVAGAVSGLLAYGVSFLDGKGGLAGWRWLFILEGIPAILLSFVALFGLPDFPEEARILKEDERTYLVDHLAARKTISGKEKLWNWAAFWDLLKQPTFYTFNLYWICHGTGGLSVQYALPTVIYQLGFTTTAVSQLMNIPPYVACFIFLNIIGVLLHKKMIRPWTTAVSIQSTTIVCYIILSTVKSPVVKYLAIIVATACAGSAYPVIWPERIRDLDNALAAGVGIGFTNAMAQFSGIAGPQIYSTDFGPTYRKSFLTCLALLCGAIAAILASWGLVVLKDRKRARAEF
ncbi:hypothetical protein PVAR5_6749 [Paecilomyces variotii No. 5]|uniref:Major facilitator superfamily (MFS) profile domain-containing protein n=1 Tax=Byssochlamys spectabilis (strain No. 5 / NBRC 109023) TaxID=1356009 RepID=V5G7S5_BYSSN|nr:hypothetical protein PVAR5_6749 [Paecilomyces variotii No. 5]